jgi:hypothetical protein
VFSNSFGQPSAYAFAGQRYLDPFGFENWYLQWTAGLLYGYVGEYEDKVPLNYKGFSPGIRTQPRLPLQQADLWPARSARRVGPDVHHCGAIAEGLALSTASAVVWAAHESH